MDFFFFYGVFLWGGGGGGGGNKRMEKREEKPYPTQYLRSGSVVENCHHVVMLLTVNATCTIWLDTILFHVCHCVQLTIQHTVLQMDFK